MPDNEKIHALHEAAQACLGWPFLDRGRGPEGIDCFGLFIRLQAALGRALPDIEYATCAGDHGALAADYAGAMERIEPGRMEPGDAIMFTGGGADGPTNHIGVYLGDGLFVHARSGVGVAIEQMVARPWCSRVAGIYRPRSAS